MFWVSCKDCVGSILNESDLFECIVFEMVFGWGNLIFLVNYMYCWCE